MSVVIGRVGVDMFPLDRAPESFDESIVDGASSSIAADTAASVQQGLFVGHAPTQRPERDASGRRPRADCKRL